MSRCRWCEELERERDEWKRRAQEKGATSPPMGPQYIGTPGMLGPGEIGLMIERAIDKAHAERERKEMFSRLRRIAQLVEKHLRKKPDNAPSANRTLTAIGEILGVEPWRMN